jgi:hypothetical protein
MYNGLCLLIGNSLLEEAVHTKTHYPSVCKPLLLIYISSNKQPLDTPDIPVFPKESNLNLHLHLSATAMVADDSAKIISELSPSYLNPKVRDAVKVVETIEMNPSHDSSIRRGLGAPKSIDAEQTYQGKKKATL